MLAPEYQIIALNDPKSSAEELRVRAAQTQQFVGELHKEFYFDTLGLRYADPSDVLSRGDRQSDVEFQLNRFSIPTRRYLGAIVLGDDGRIRSDLQALIGLGVLNAPDNPQQPLELVEWNVQKEHRGNGVGKQLLLELLAPHGGSAEREIVLKVVENSPTIATYEHIGFTQTGEPTFEEVFTANHITMSARLGQVHAHLRV